MRPGHPPPVCHPPDFPALSSCRRFLARPGRRPRRCAAAGAPPGPARHRQRGCNPPTNRQERRTGLPSCPGPRLHRERRATPRAPPLARAPSPPHSRGTARRSPRRPPPAAPRRPRSRGSSTNRCSSSPLVFRSFPGAGRRSWVAGDTPVMSGSWILEGEEESIDGSFITLVRVIRRCFPAPPYRARWPVCWPCSGRALPLRGPGRGLW